MEALRPIRLRILGTEFYIDGVTHLSISEYSGKYVHRCFDVLYVSLCYYFLMHGHPYSENS